MTCPGFMTCLAAVWNGPFIRWARIRNGRTLHRLLRLNHGRSFGGERFDGLWRKGKRGTSDTFARPSMPASAGITKANRWTKSKVAAAMQSMPAMRPAAGTPANRQICDGKKRGSRAGNSGVGIHSLDPAMVRMVNRSRPARVTRISGTTVRSGTFGNVGELVSAALIRTTRRHRIRLGCYSHFPRRRPRAVQPFRSSTR
jgi:hypothetical protein